MRPAAFTSQPRLIEFMEPLIGPGFSSGAYLLRFNRAVHRRDYERWLALLPRRADARTSAAAGRVLRLLGRTEEARARFAAALERDGGRADAHAWRWELERSASPARAAAGLDRAVALEPGNPWWRVMKGADALVRGRLDPARRSLEAALESKGPPALAFALMGIARSREKRLEKSLPLLDEALRLEPGTSWFYKQRAGVRARLGDEAGALADVDGLMLREEGFKHLHILSGRPGGFEELEALLPWLDRFIADAPACWALVLRANLRRHKSHNDYAGNLRDLEKAAALAPASAWARAYLARTRGLAKAHGAREAFDEAVRLAPDCAWIRTWRGEFKRHQGDLPGALADLDRALALHPYYTMAYIARGAARRSLGKNAAAQADLDVALELAPDYGWVYYERMLARRAQGRPADALEDLERAHRLDPKFALARRPEELPQALRDMDALIRREPANGLARAWRGEARSRSGDHAGALEDLDRAAALDGARGRTFLWRGRALARLGRPEDALADFEKAAKLEPGDPEAYAELAVVLRDRGRLKPALAVLARAMKKARSSVWICVLRGQAELALGRSEEALASFEAALQLAPPPFAAAFDPLLGRAQVRLARGEREAAGEDLEAASRLQHDPSQAERLAALRSALERSGG